MKDKIKVKAASFDDLRRFNDLGLRNYLLTYAVMKTGEPMVLKRVQLAANIDPNDYVIGRFLRGFEGLKDEDQVNVLALSPQYETYFEGAGMERLMMLKKAQ